MAALRYCAQWLHVEPGTAATFHVCARCGTVPLVTSRIGERVYAVVNVNALEGLDASRFRRTGVSFEGEDVESRLARRQRNWIGRVRFTRA